MPIPNETQFDRLNLSGYSVWLCPDCDFWHGAAFDTRGCQVEHLSVKGNSVEECVTLLYQLLEEELRVPEKNRR